MTMTSGDMQRAIERYCEGEEIAAANFPGWGYGDFSSFELRFKSGRLLLVNLVLRTREHGILPTANLDVGTWKGHPKAGFDNCDSPDATGSRTLIDAYDELVDKENERYEKGDDAVDSPLKP